MKRVLFFFIFSMVVIFLLAWLQTHVTESAISSSNEAVETFSLGSQFYEQGQYPQAAQAYQQIIDQGYAHIALFYNMGNACYKQEKIGCAILNYRRAERLSPRDQDIRANLALAREKTIDQLAQPHDAAFISSMAHLTLTWLNMSELSLLALSTWLFIALLWLLFRSNLLTGSLQEWLQYGTILAALVCMALTASLISRLYLESTRPDAVILADEVNVSSSPAAQSVTAFTLHSGAEVSLLDVRNNWVRIALPGEELQGWISTDTIETIATDPFELRRSLRGFLAPLQQ